MAPNSFRMRLVLIGLPFCQVALHQGGSQGWNAADRLKEIFVKCIAVNDLAQQQPVERPVAKILLYLVNSAGDSSFELTRIRERACSPIISL